MRDFAWSTAITVFLTYVIIDMMYAWYILAVARKQAFTSAMLTSCIYSLLAYGVVSYSQNIAYLAFLASGAFVGTYITVRLKR